DMEKIADSYFDATMTARERAIFETGIKLTTIFHQFGGTPIANDPKIIKDVSTGIEAAILSQPYVKKAKIQIIFPQDKEEKEERIHGKFHPYDYTEISGRNLVAEVLLEYNNWEIVGKVEWKEDLQYPLMYIKKILEKNLHI
ncbi:MAG: dihydroneopterin aldolase family protein, partial [Promethearchaeota archaeon]